MGSPLRLARRVWRRGLAGVHHGVAGSPERGFRLPASDTAGTLAHLRSAPLPGPALTAADVDDYGEVGFVADPFLFADEDLHLLFEVFNPYADPTAVIGHAVSTDGGRGWRYDGVVFEHDRHVSFPYVFEHGGEVYMVPDIANEDGRVAPARLYRAARFPDRWEAVADVVDAAHQCLDTVVFRHWERWWALTGGGDNDELRAYHSERLTAPDWTPHEQNPVVTDRPEAGRPAGRPLFDDGRLLVPLQDCREEYGAGLRLYEVTSLTPGAYEDAPAVPGRLLEGTGGAGWNSGRMHHLDVVAHDGGLFCAVDGDVGAGRNRLGGPMWSVSVGTTVGSER